MLTTERKNLFKRQPKLMGGIRQDLSTWDPEQGWWTLSGVHGNDTDALTKWSGSALWLPTRLPARITGMFQATLASSQHFFLMSNGNVYRCAADGSGLSILVTGDVPSFYDGRTFGSMFFMASGNNVNRKILSTLAVQGVGVAAPPNAPIASAGGAGPLTGAYLYVLTYKNSLSGAESNQSIPSASITVAAKVIHLASFPLPTDPQVDTYVLYRTTAGGGIYQKVVELPLSTLTYDDNTVDGDLGIQASIFRDVPPAARFLEVYNGMLLYTGFAKPIQNRVMPSEILLPEAVSQFNVYDLDPEDNDQITGIKKFGQAVAVYKNNSLFLGSGLTPDGITFVRTRVVESALGNFGIIGLKSSHAYLSQKGPHVFGGLQEEYIGRPIEGIYQTFDPSELENASGVYYKPLNMLIWNVRTFGQSDYDTWLIYHMIVKEWSTRQYASSKLSIYLDALDRAKLWIGSTTGQVLTGDVGHADNGVPIAIDAITRGVCLKYVGKNPDLDQLYCFRHIEVYYDPNAGSAVITVSMAVDSPVNPFRPIGTFNPSTGTRTRFNVPQESSYGRLAFIRFTGVSTEPLKIRGYRVEGLPLGRF